MKKTNLEKVVFSILVGLIVVCMANFVFAENFTDITESINNTTSNTTNNVTNNTTNNATLNNTTNNAAVLTTNNTANYNNSSLPSTGIGDAMPATLLIVVLGISAVYAYKKMQDYKNI